MDGLKSFAKRLVNNYAPGPSAARFSVVSFQSVATTRVGWSTNQVDIDAAIDQMEADGATSISAGFEAAGQLFIASRPGATKIVLLFSDGEQIDDFGGPNMAIASADIVKESGVTVFAWGFGFDVSLGTLQKIATDPRKAISANTIGELSGYLADLEAAVCNVSPSPPPMPPSTSPPSPSPSPSPPSAPPCPAYQVGVDYPGSDVQIPGSNPRSLNTPNVVSATACASLCQDNAVPFFGFGHSSPYLGRCWCKSVLKGPRSLSSLTSGHACARNE